MIIDLNITNFRCFRTPQSFSMVALRESKKIIPTKPLLNTKEKLVPIATILGANASGKSNFIRVVKTLAAIVNTPACLISIGDFYYRNRFRFTEEMKPIELEIRFLTNSQIYLYGIVISESGIEKEYLYKPQNQHHETYLDEETIFERNQNEIEYGLTQTIRPTVSSNEPLLPKLNIEDVMIWFKQLCFCEDVSITTLKEYMQNPDFNIIVNEVLEREMSLKHEFDDKKYELSLEDESQGTRRIISLLWHIYQTHLGKDTVFIIDDLDKGFHDGLMKDIYNMFLSTFEDRNCQLIFTSHSFFMLQSKSYDSSAFAIDNTWLCQKFNGDDCDLVPISDFKTIEGKVYDSYVNGRFGHFCTGLGSVRSSFYEVEWRKRDKERDLETPIETEA